jgi:hypothetical protein
MPRILRTLRPVLRVINILGQDRSIAMSWSSRARKKARDRLPKKIAEMQTQGAELLKAAKGIG